MTAQIGGTQYKAAIDGATVVRRVVGWLENDNNGSGDRGYRRNFAGFLRRRRVRVAEEIGNELCSAVNYLDWTSRGGRR